MRSIIVGAFVIAGIFELSGVASAAITNDPTASCTTTVVCAPVGVPILSVDRALTDLLHLGASS